MLFEHISQIYIGTVYEICRRKYFMREFIQKMISVALASGLAIESSVHKPGNVSPLRGVGDSFHHGFILASHMISHGLLDVMRSYEKSDCIDLGEAIYKVYKYGERIHGMRNLHLGFVLMILPIALGLNRFYNANDKKALINILSDHEKILDIAHEYLKECGTKSDGRFLLKLLHEIYGKDVAIHRGYTPDIFSDEYVSLWDLIRHGRRSDVVLDELYSNYPRTRSVVEVIKDSREPELYAVIKDLFIKISSRYIDTHIARRKSLFLALIYRDHMRFCLDLMKISEKLFDKCIEFFDEIYRKISLNPGSIADIMACAIGVRNLSLVKKDLSTNVLF
jgi:triphosphoribosyl-dephospho-CoA synthetase